MSDENQSPTRNRRWFRPLPMGVAGAALAIAAVAYFGNAGGPVAASCPARTAEAKAVGDAAGGQLAALTPTGTGRSYADISFVDDTGRPMTLKDFAGRPLLVNFWATWCVPCREEMPALNALAASYTDDVFSVVPVNLDSGGDAMDKVRAFLDEKKLSNLPLLSDSTLSSFDRLKSTGVALGLPSTVLVDATGCEIAILQGPAEWNSDDGHKVVDKLIEVASLKS